MALSPNFRSFRQLQNVDSVLQRTTIIGVILCFRSLAQEALQDVLDKRIPFLMTSIKDFQQHMPNTQDSAIANIRSQVEMPHLTHYVDAYLWKPVGDIA